MCRVELLTTAEATEMRNAVKEAGVQETRPPYVGAALICDLLLAEGDSTVSAIRIVDRFEVSNLVQVIDEPGAEFASTDLPFPISFTVLVIVKGFPRTGIQTIVLRPFGPDSVAIGEDHPIDVEVEGPLRGATVRLQSQIVVRQSGSHWFSVRYRGRELTRIVFEIVDKRTIERIDPGTDPDPRAVVYGRRGQTP